jgi:hypothetical protein
VNLYRVRFYSNQTPEIEISAEGYGRVDNFLVEFYSDGHTIATFLLSEVCVRLVVDDDAEPVEDFDE